MIQISGILNVEFECAECGKFESTDIGVAGECANDFNFDFAKIDISEAVEDLEYNGWRLINGKWYCPDCIEELDLAD